MSEDNWSKHWAHDYDPDTGVCSGCGKVRDPSEGGRPPGIVPVRDDDGLTERERQVVDRADQSQSAIARDLEISRQQVNQIVKRLKERGQWPN